MSIMQQQQESSALFGSNAPFIEEQYEIYLANPGAVSADWRSYFDQLRDGAPDVSHAPVIDSFIQLAKNRRLAAPMVDAQAMHKLTLVLRVISKYRTLGLLQADLDPLKRRERPYLPDLDIKTYAFSDADLESEFDVGSYRGAPEGASRMRLRELIVALGGAYCGTFPAEYLYMSYTPQKRFIQQLVEPLRSRPK